MRIQYIDLRFHAWILMLIYFLCLPLRICSSANNATGEDSDGTLLAIGKHLFLNKTSPSVANTTISGLVSNKAHKDVKTSSSSTTLDVTSDLKGSVDRLDYTELLVSAIVMGGLIIISIIISCVVCIVKGRKRKAVAKTIAPNNIHNPSSPTISDRTQRTSLSGVTNRRSNTSVVDRESEQDVYIDEDEEDVYSELGPPELPPKNSLDVSNESKTTQIHLHLGSFNSQAKRTVIIHIPECFEKTCSWTANSKVVEDNRDSITDNNTNCYEEISSVTDNAAEAVAGVTSSTPIAIPIQAMPSHFPQGSSGHSLHIVLPGESFAAATAPTEVVGAQSSPPAQHLLSNPLMSNPHLESHDIETEVAEVEIIPGGDADCSVDVHMEQAKQLQNGSQPHSKSEISLKIGQSNELPGLGEQPVAVGDDSDYGVFVVS